MKTKSKGADLVKLMHMYYRIRGMVRSISGAPPLSCKAKKNCTLKNYRICGNTVGGKGVGDKTANLFDYNTATEHFVPNHAIGTQGNIVETQNSSYIDMYIPVEPDTDYTISNCLNNVSRIIQFDASKHMITRDPLVSSQQLPFTFHTKALTRFILLQSSNSTQPSFQSLMLNEGSEDMAYEQYGYRVAVTAGGVNIFDENYEGLNTLTYYRPLYVGDGTFTLSTNAPKNSSDTTNLYLIAGAVSTGASYVNNGVSLNSPHTVTSVDGYVTVAYRISGGIDPSEYHAMLNKGSSALPYEPYSEPVTTNIYLPEQISKVGNVTEYIDYREQKQYFADGTSADVTLPALSLHKGTNILSAGTEVRPSSVEIKGRIKNIS